MMILILFHISNCMTLAKLMSYLPFYYACNQYRLIDIKVEHKHYFELLS